MAVKLKNLQRTTVIQPNAVAPNVEHQSQMQQPPEPTVELTTSAQHEAPAQLTVRQCELKDLILSELKNEARCRLPTIKDATISALSQVLRDVIAAKLSQQHC